MRSVKSRSKRLKRRSRRQRGGAILIKHEQITNEIYDFEMIKYPDNDEGIHYLVIKNTPGNFTERVGLIITHAYKSNDSSIKIESFTTVDDLKKFVLETESKPIHIMIETDDRLQDQFTTIFKERKAKAKAQAEADIHTKFMREYMMSSKGKPHIELFGTGMMHNESPASALESAVKLEDTKITKPTYHAPLTTRLGGKRKSKRKSRKRKRHRRKTRRH